MEPTVYVAIIGGLCLILVAIINKYRPRNNTEKNITEKAIIINDVKHIQEDIKEIKDDIQNLYDGETKNHAEFDRIMGKIHELELKFVEYRGVKKR